MIASLGANLIRLHSQTNIDKLKIISSKSEHKIVNVNSSLFISNSGYFIGSYYRLRRDYGHILLITRCLIVIGISILEFKKKVRFHGVLRYLSLIAILTTTRDKTHAHIMRPIPFINPNPTTYSKQPIL